MTTVKVNDPYEIVHTGILSRKIVTVGDAAEKTGLSREQIINFVKQNDYLRIYDEMNTEWFNEDTNGHCQLSKSATGWLLFD